MDKNDYDKVCYHCAHFENCKEKSSFKQAKGIAMSNISTIPAIATGKLHIVFKCLNFDLDLTN